MGNICLGGGVLAITKPWHTCTCMFVCVQSATGVYLTALPAPGGIQIAGKTPGDLSNEHHILSIQKRINDTIVKNKEIYQINPPVRKTNTSIKKKKEKKIQIGTRSVRKNVWWHFRWRLGDHLWRSVLQYFILTYVFACQCCINVILLSVSVSSTPKMFLYL